jgi:hypothetical protein
MHIRGYMLTCEQRIAVRERTLASLRATDWGAQPRLEVDQESSQLLPHIRMAAAIRGLLRSAIESATPFILFLEDDLRFNRHLRYNIERWLEGLRAAPDRHFFATLFNPSGPSIGLRVNRTTFVVDEKCAFGSQALLFSSATARHFLDNWDRHRGLHDFRMYQLAALVGPIYCHSPSLVQHVNVQSTWGGPFSRACDFLADWKACSGAAEGAIQH